MKKLIVFILIAVMLCLAKFSFTQNLTLDKLFPSSSVEVYVQQEEVADGFYSIKNGSGSIIFCSAKEFGYINKRYNVVGYTFKISDNIDTVYKTLKSGVIKSGNRLYGNSPFLPKGISFDCRNINFQVENKNGAIYVGYPILLGSY